MSGHTKWSEIKHKAAPDPVRDALRAKEARRYYNRAWWRLVRLADRVLHALRHRGAN